MTTIEIKGMDELQAILRDLPGQISRKLVVTALKKASKPMKDEAVNLAPKRKGTLKKAIVTVENRYEDLPGVMIAPTKGKRVTNDAWYARFQELGTSGFGKRRRSLKSVSVDLKQGKVHRKYQTIGYKQKGAGLPAREFMQKAFLAKQGQLKDGIHEELSKVVTKYLRSKAPGYVS